MNITQLARTRRALRHLSEADYIARLIGDWEEVEDIRRRIQAARHPKGKRRPSKTLSTQERIAGYQQEWNAQNYPLNGVVQHGFSLSQQYFSAPLGEPGGIFGRGF